MTSRKNDDRNKLIVALDVESAAEARRLVNTLSGVVGMFKIGSQLFTAAGPELVREIVNSGERVFLDLKFHDIPNTVAAAGVEAARLGVSIFNVHAAGGSEMMRRTVAAVAEAVDRESLPRPAIIAVTVLTSSNSNTLRKVGFIAEVHDVVRRLALLAEASGIDGVVASPLELGIVRTTVKNAGFIIVTPGVRPAGSALGDQKRVTTPRQAILAGADYLVVGRPILQSPDPVRAAQGIIDEMEIEAAKGV
ncbi:MAG TPA: orotidine-5'-phosphate decarboxylase [Pyrinomonadaceae bacterium]|nr:orotidine-5'-phosphate decarboxylase [Pyrinomonadaceae bacterium]